MKTTDSGHIPIIIGNVMYTHYIHTYPESYLTPSLTQYTTTNYKCASWVEYLETTEARFYELASPPHTHLTSPQILNNTTLQFNYTINNADKRYSQEK